MVMGVGGLVAFSTYELAYFNHLSSSSGSEMWSPSLRIQVLCWVIYFYFFLMEVNNLPGVASSKESTRQCSRCKRRGFDPWVRKIPCSGAWQPTPVFLPAESHGQRSLAGTVYRIAESDTTEVT